MQDDLAYLLCVNELEGLRDTLHSNYGCVVLLATRGGVDGTPVDDEDVALAMIEHVGENVYHLGVEVHQVVVLVIEIIGLRQMHSRIEDGLGSLGNTLLALSDLVVEVAWDRLFRELGDAVGRDAPGLHGYDPVINS